MTDEAQMLEQLALHSANYVLSFCQAQAGSLLQERNSAVRVQPLTQSINEKIGGVAGLGATAFKADINLPRISYAAGETMTVNLALDNSKCKKPIKTMKVKLMRKVECLGSGRVLWS